jgi:hypothetical protein
MSDFDPAEQIVTAKQLAHAFDETPAQIVALTRLGILRAVHLSEKSLTSEPRYEFLESLRAYLPYWRAQGLPAGIAQPGANIDFGFKHNREKRNPE